MAIEDILMSTQNQHHVRKNCLGNFCTVEEKGSQRRGTATLSVEKLKEMEKKKKNQENNFKVCNFHINNDLVIHRQVKTNDIISRRFGDLMTPSSRVQMRIKLTNASSRNA